jgi:thiamine pyrophosphate-dependent acetolactate synthase large subunit-like protein
MSVVATQTPPLTGAEWVQERARLAAQELFDLGVRRAFVVASVHNVHLLKELEAVGVRSIAARTELGCAHIADGYARASGEPTLLVTSTGPGAGNAVGGFATAAKDGSPVLHVTTSNLPRAGEAHGTHTVPDQGLWHRSFEAPVIDFTTAQPGELRVRLGRGGAATIIVPVTKDGTGPTIDWNHDPPSQEPPPLPDLAQSLSTWLDAPQRLLWIGGGCRSVPVERLVRFAEASGAAVVTSTQAKDLFPADHPHYVGCGWTARARDAAGSADACLALGTRFTEITTRIWAEPFPRKLVRVAWSSDVAGFADIEQEHLACDVSVALDVAERLVADAEPSSFGAAAGAAMRERLAAIDRDRVEYALLDAIDAALGPDDVLVCDMTKLSFWAAPELELRAGTRFVWPGLLQIGYGLPAGIGAALARPDAHVIVLTGDGSLITTLTEFDAGVAAGARLSIVLIDDDGYGMLRPHLGEPLGGPLTTFDGPDWGLLARGFGGEFVDLPADGEALRAVLQERPATVRLIRVDGRDVSKDFLAL